PQPDLLLPAIDIQHAQAHVAAPALDVDRFTIEGNAEATGPVEILEIERSAEALTVTFQGEQLLRGDFTGDAVDAIQVRVPFRILHDREAAIEIDEQWLQVQRVVEIDGQQLEVQDAAVEVARPRLQERLDDGDEHVLAQAALRLLAAAHQLGVEAGVGLGRLAPVQHLGAQDADERDRQSGQQSAERLHEDGHLVPEILPLGG